MKDGRFDDLTRFRAEGLTWNQIAPKYPGTNARALGKAFSVARLARGGAPLRKDKPRGPMTRRDVAKVARSLPATFNGTDPNVAIKEMLREGQARALDEAARMGIALDALEGQNVV